MMAFWMWGLEFGGGVELIFSGSGFSFRVSGFGFRVPRISEEEETSRSSERHKLRSSRNEVSCPDILAPLGTLGALIPTIPQHWSAVRSGR